jgi:hypothetical protein
MEIVNSVWFHCLFCSFGSIISYLLFGSLFHYIWYFKQKENQKEWKCQPVRQLSLTLG